MIIHFTKNANKKFDILNRHHVFFTREQIEDVVKSPDKTGEIGKYMTAQKDDIKVLYFQDGNIVRIATFYPIKD